MTHRTLMRLLYLGLPLAPVAGALVANAANASDAAISIAAFLSFSAYGAFVFVRTRCPKCRAATMDHPWRIPKFCHACNLDLTRSHR